VRVCAASAICPSGRRKAAETARGSDFTEDATLVDSLRAQERAWEARPLTRWLYEDWFREIGVMLSPVEGRSIELGSGISRLSTVVPGIEATDVVSTPWTSTVVDAEALPYAERAVANIVLVDVFHHLARPARFLDEASRVLAPGGRVIVLDPYCSPVSKVTYGLFHHERVDLGADAFADDPAVAEDPLASNQARATLAFFREASELARRWPELVVLERRLLAMLAYPLSGGLTGRRLVPTRLGHGVQHLEARLGALLPLLATRCLVVLERRGVAVSGATPAPHGSDAELPEGERSHSR
jgi:SAM-dependent methyltransferase